MGKWVIAKEFAGDYGHRVWSQQLDGELSCDNKCVCRHLHGHRATIIVHLEGDELVDGMVTDFHHLNWFKKFLDEVLDHKMILDIHDPLLSTILPDYFMKEGAVLSDLLGDTIAKEKFVDSITNLHTDGYRTLKDWDEFKLSHLREHYEGIVLVPFVPTSENLARWLHEVVQNKMKKLDVTVQRIQFYETPKSQSNYII